jgi:3-isopropylmalate dehydrogenase
VDGSGEEYGMQKKIVVLPGDGIGPEVMTEAIKIVDEVGRLFGHDFQYEYDIVGGKAIDDFGIPLREETLERCKAADAVLLGAVGGPKWDQLPGHLRPEMALLGLRKGLGLFANLRPVEVFGPLVGTSTLKSEVVEGVDLLVVRELTGGLYFGKKERSKSAEGIDQAIDELVYNEQEIERIAKVAFEAARVRRKKVSSVDKANVLESGRLWREVVSRVHQDYPDVELEHVLVDNAAMQLIKYPKQFDVVVTENMFGDILSDEASMLAGSIGLMPSASLSDEAGKGMYEPVHGSAPDIAGQGKANPLATILSCAMMLRYSFGLQEEANLIEQAVKNVLDRGVRTGDLATAGDTISGTTEITDYILDEIKLLKK